MDLLIMSRDNIGAKWENGSLTVIDEKKLPLYLINTQNVPHWLEMRAIDSSRPNARLLKKILGLSEEEDDISTVMSVNAATITDTYWVKEIGSELTYKDIGFNNDYYGTLALLGYYDRYNSAMTERHPKNTKIPKDKRTPELTNIGSFEKCWRLKDGKWWLYKKATHKEQFSELFIYELGKALGMKMAVYELGFKSIKTKDFTNNASVNFEPAYSFMGENKNYIDTIRTIKKFGAISENLIPDYVRMIFLDTIVGNPDRHTFNFGVLRNVNSGEIIGLAPNFDNNMALVSRGYAKDIKRKDDLLVKLFLELLKYDKDLKKFVPLLPDMLLWKIFNKLDMRVKANMVVDFILSGYRAIRGWKTEDIEGDFTKDQRKFIGNITEEDIKDYLNKN